MGEEDQPPEEIWLDPEAVNAHFEAVNTRIRSGAPSESVPEATDMSENELTKGLRR